jgi:hypothetical protein
LIILRFTSLSCTKTIKIAQHIFMCVSKQVNEEVIRDTNVYVCMVQLLSSIHPLKAVINVCSRRQMPKINQGLYRIWFLQTLFFWLTCYRQLTIHCRSHSFYIYIYRTIHSDIDSPRMPIVLFMMFVVRYGWHFLSFLFAIH